MKLPLGPVLASTLALAATVPLPLSAASNPLANEASALVQAQADSPVQWMPWGEAAFARAQREQKPVFVAVGVFASELTRAMARQTFSNADAGAQLNENFVCVYVDGKERPDVSALYQNYLQTVKQLSGPPMNIWLTPDLKPFEGANYLPPTEEWGKEGFITASRRVAAAWKADAAAQQRKGNDAVADVVAAQPQAVPPAATPNDIARLLKESADAWRAQFDAARGGFGESPKQPEPELLRFLLADESTRDMALTTLQALINGALRDPLDGGFYRYAVDAEWRQPYFQKLSVDQPRIALALLDAGRLTAEPRYGAAARDALLYVVEQLGMPGGDIVAVQDATAETTTAAYCWTADDVRELLGADAAEEFSRLHGISAEGNIPPDAFPGIPTQGKNILYRAVPLPPTGPEPVVVKAATTLLKQRQQRAVELRDDGSPSGTHGLMLTALARAGAELKEPRLANAAKKEYTFIRDQLGAKSGALVRLAGRSVPATPADYAFVIEGLLTFAQTANEPEARSLAQQLLQRVQAEYWDAAAARFFVVPAKGSGFWARVHSPAGGTGEPPAADAAMLLALAGGRLDQEAASELRSALVRSLAAAIKDAGEAPRGEFLLALNATQ